MEPLGRFLEYSMESLESILKAPLGQTLGQKPSGPAAPRVFGLGSGLGGPSIFSLGTPLRTLGNLPRGSIHHYTPSAFPQIVPLLYLVIQQSPLSSPATQEMQAPGEGMEMTTIPQQSGIKGCF